MLRSAGITCGQDRHRSTERRRVDSLSLGGGEGIDVWEPVAPNSFAQYGKIAKATKNRITVRKDKLVKAVQKTRKGVGIKILSKSVKRSFLPSL